MDTPTIGLSFAAGLLSFLSPCVLPLLPSYLSFVGGVTIKQMQQDVEVRRGLVVNTAFFVLGFSVVFITLGVVFSSSALLFPNLTRYINIVAGAIVVVLGLNIIFDFIAVLNMERRLHLRKRPNGKVGSFLVGLAFAAGWTPCIGPILTSILFLAGASGRVATGVLYLAIYSAGLSVPFLLTAIFFNSATGLFQKIKKHFLSIRIISGLLLVFIGTLIAIGRFQNLNIGLYRTAVALNDWAESSPGPSRVVPGIVLVLLALVFLYRESARLIKRLRSADDGRPENGTEESNASADLTTSADGVCVAKRVHLPVAALLGGLIMLVAVLQFAGAISVIDAVGGWLQFQGL